MSRIKNADATARTHVRCMKDRLLSELARRWLTPQDALRAVGCMSLAQRVSQWRAAGYEFHQRVVQTGPRTRVAAYKLARKPVGG
jgi:hypothetical protein